MNNKSLPIPVTVAKGDGIGPEIMDATLRILEAAGAHIAPEFVTLGEQAFEHGHVNGITQKAWESLNRTGVLLKSPLTTPQGKGYKSVNVTLRKTFGMFANVRPVKTFSPYVPSKHHNIDMMIVRENEEDLYAGIEYRQTENTCHSIKLLSQAGTEKIIRYAYELATSQGRKKVTCLVKDNIMKITDGLFHKTFKEIGKEYPHITQEVLIVDIGMARIADTPENFDVVVTLNLYGDIVSDIASQISGSVGLAGSVNLGEKLAMFEAVHGSAPDIAGKGIANPSGLLNGAMLMLEHIGQSECAAKISNAWLAAIEAQHVTCDIAQEGVKPLSTQQFADKVIAFLGEKPKKLQQTKVQKNKPLNISTTQKVTKSPMIKKLVGVDVFVDWPGTNPKELAHLVECTQTSRLFLSAIGSRGLKVYPSNMDFTPAADLWRCRFFTEAETQLTPRDIRALLAGFDTLNLNWVKLENLYTFNKENGFSALQGE